MQEIKTTSSIIPVRKLAENLKRFIVFWIIAAILAFLIIGGWNISSGLAHRQISAAVNYSFDGAEEGNDPFGNKLDVNEIKSRSGIEEALDALNIPYDNVDRIYSAIHISGNIPANVISKITGHTAAYADSTISNSENIRDIAYYPTQYTITMDCYKLDMDFDDCVRLLNDLTERYETAFYNNYGYNEAIEDAMISIDYNDYDYVDAADIYDSNLISLKNYVDELRQKDDIRFRSEKSGYTFSDLSKAIETLRTEDLEFLASLITSDNLTKNQDNLLENYRIKIEELERKKVINREQLDAIEETISVYQKNTVIFFNGNQPSGMNLELSQSSDAYKNLIDNKVLVQKNLTDCEQKIRMYEARIENLERETADRSESIVKDGFEKLEKKVEKLLSDVKTTVDEYYREVVLKDSCRISSKVSDSTYTVVKYALRNSVSAIIAVELVILGTYIIFCLLAVKISEKRSAPEETGKNRPTKEGIK